MGTTAHAIALLALLLAAMVPMVDVPSAAVWARPVVARIHTGGTRHFARPATRRRRAPATRARRPSTRQITQYLGSRRKVITVTGHRLHHHVVRQFRQEPRPRYAYALDFFMINAPAFDQTPMSPEQAQKVANAFKSGTAEHIPTRALVRAGVAQYYPMRGGIFWRREPVTYIVVHSTETGIPLGAKRVIDSWTSMGRRHPGAQYVVDRDGTIFQAVDPDLGTVHVNIFKTLPGINNDNSIGIEMVHTGRQTYTAEQRASVIRLVHYLQDRYKVSDDSVITHRYAQQGDHTDPVAFNWDNFLKEKSRFRSVAVAGRMNRMVDEAETAWQEGTPTVSTTYLQIHTTLPPNPTLSVSPPADAQTLEQFAAPGATAAASEESSDLATVNDEPPQAMARQPGHTNVALPADSSTAPALRGEIDVDPKTARLLLKTPVQTAEPEEESQPGSPSAEPGQEPQQKGSLAEPDPEPQQATSPAQSGLEPQRVSPSVEQPSTSTDSAAKVESTQEPQPASSPTGDDSTTKPEPAPAESPQESEPVDYFIHQPTPVGPPASE